MTRTEYWMRTQEGCVQQAVIEVQNADTLHPTVVCDLTLFRAMLAELGWERT